MTRSDDERAGACSRWSSARGAGEVTASLSSGGGGPQRGHVQATTPDSGSTVWLPRPVEQVGAWEARRAAPETHSPWPSQGVGNAAAAQSAAPFVEQRGEGGRGQKFAHLLRRECAGGSRQRRSKGSDRRAGEEWTDGKKRQNRDGAMGRGVQMHLGLLHVRVRRAGSLPSSPSAPSSLLLARCRSLAVRAQLHAKLPPRLRLHCVLTATAPSNEQSLSTAQAPAGQSPPTEGPDAADVGPPQWFAAPRMKSQSSRLSALTTQRPWLPSSTAGSSRADQLWGRKSGSSGRAPFPHSRQAVRAAARPVAPFSSRSPRLRSPTAGPTTIRGPARAVRLCHQFSRAPPAQRPCATHPLLFRPITARAEGSLLPGARQLLFQSRHGQLGEDGQTGQNGRVACRACMAPSQSVPSLLPFRCRSRFPATDP